MENTKQGIFFIGNPLLDISVELKDNVIIDKYGLQAGQASLCTPEQLPLYDELWNIEGRSAIPGGSALNSARSANFFLKNLGSETENLVTYYGSLGNDEKGAVLEKDLKDNGITGNFHKAEKTPTGTCAVLVGVTKDRTLCANLAAACEYDQAHLNANLSAMESAKLIYSTSFFITSSNDSLKQVGQYASDNDVPFAFNLSAVFLLMFELDKVLASLEHADYVFANEDEAAEFAKTQKLDPKDLKGVAVALANWKKSNTKRQRIAIVTQGPGKVLVSVGGKEVTEYEVADLSNDVIVDTNGAGDAFVGGFMAQLYLEKPLD